MRRMWFGTKRFSRWIKVNSPGSEYAASGFSSSLDYLSGGIGMRRSLSGHESRQLTWNRLTEQESREITDFAYGTFGDGPFYLSDPGQQRLNVLNKPWSMPGLGGKDSVPLAGTKRPTLVSNPDQSRGYPVDMAKYQVDGSTPRRSFYVPIPPGYTAWVGVHGDEASSAGIQVQPTVSGVAAGVPTVVPVTGVDTAQRVTNSFPAAGDQAGIELSLEAPDPVVNLFTNPNLVAGAGTVEVRRNLWPDPSMKGTSSVAGQGATLAAVAGGLEVTRTGSPGRATTPAAKRIAVSPSTSYWITSRRVVAVAVGSSGSLDGRFNITGYDSTGSHRSNGFSLAWGSAPTVGTEIIDQQITTPDWVVSLELNWYTGGNNGDKVVWDRIGILTAPGYFDGGYSLDPDLTASWTGPANASASILTGVPVAGATLQSTAVAYRSLSTPGGMTMRTSRENYSRVQYSIPGSGSRTTLLTLSSPAPRLVYMETGGQVTPVPLPGGGTEVTVWVGAVWTNGYFYVGNRPDVPTADRDIPVTVRKPGVFAGAYNGPWFSGNSEGAHWNGAVDASTSTRDTYSATLAGVIVQVLPNGETPEQGDFISGQGMSGADFEGIVRSTPYSYAHDSYGLSVKLVEAEEWQ